MRWGKRVCDGVQQKGYWADLTDPSSGLPVRRRLRQVDARVTLTLRHWVGLCAYRSTASEAQVPIQTSRAACSCCAMRRCRWGAVRSWCIRHGALPVTPVRSFSKRRCRWSKMPWTRPWGRFRHDMGGFHVFIFIRYILSIV